MIPRRERDRRACECGRPEAYDFPVARVPGLDFSFSGLKTALLYTVRDLRRTSSRPTADLAASYQRAIVRALVERVEATGARADRGRRRCRGQLRAPGRAAGRRARAARALHRQRGDDRLGGPLHRARPVPGVPFARCACLRVAPLGSLAVAIARRRAGRGRRRARAQRQRRPSLAVSWRGLVGEPRARGADRAAHDRRPARRRRSRSGSRRRTTRPRRRSARGRRRPTRRSSRCCSTLAAQGVTVQPDFSYYARPRRLLRRARPARGLAARADAGGRRRLSGARGVPCLRLGVAALDEEFGAVERPPARRRRCRATTAAA